MTSIRCIHCGKSIGKDKNALPYNGEGIKGVYRYNTSD